MPPREKKPRLPVLVMLDLDRTMVGNVMPVTDTLEVEDNYSRLCHSEKGLECSSFDSNGFLDEMLRRGLLRPHLERALKSAQKVKGLNVFVFSAGQKAYVDKVVAGIERVTGVKFARPILTRNDVVGYRDLKHMHWACSRACASLKKKFPALADEANVTRVMEERMVFIDDRDDHILPRDFSNNILCPVYSMEIACDPFAHLPNSARFDIRVLEKITTTAIPALDAYFAAAELPVYARELPIHAHMAAEIAKTVPQNQKAGADTFFKSIAEVFEGVSSGKTHDWKKVFDKLKRAGIGK